MARPTSPTASYLLGEPSLSGPDLQPILAWYTPAARRDVQGRARRRGDAQRAAAERAASPAQSWSSPASLYVGTAEDNNGTRFGHFLRRVQRRVLWVGGARPVLVAAGRFDVYWEEGPRPWDVQGESCLCAKPGVQLPITRPVEPRGAVRPAYSGDERPGARAGAGRHPVRRRCAASRPICMSRELRPAKAKNPMIRFALSPRSDPAGCYRCERGRSGGPRAKSALPRSSCSCRRCCPSAHTTRRPIRRACCCMTATSTRALGARVDAAQVIRERRVRVNQIWNSTRRNAALVGEADPAYLEVGSCVRLRLGDVREGGGRSSTRARAGPVHGRSYST